MSRLAMALASLSLCVAPCPLAFAQSATSAAADAARWRSDLRLIVDSLVARHPNPFHRVARSVFDSAVRATDRRLAGLSTPERVVALARIVALIGDAHTSLDLIDSAAGFLQAPMRLERFSDGVFVRAAGPPYTGLIGARLTRVGTLDVQSALDSVALVLPHENTFWVEAWGPTFLAVPGVMYALHASPSPDSLMLEVERDGVHWSVTVRGTDRIAFARPSALLPAAWVDSRSSVAQPLWLRFPERTWWFEYLPDRRALYVCYRGVAYFADGETNARFLRRVFAAADSLAPELLVLDVRENGGGNGLLNRDFVRAVVQRPWLDAPDRLFILIGPRTFSAAQNLVDLFAYLSDASLVGQPTGNAPTQFGDAVAVRLPGTGLTLRVSTQLHQSPFPRDTRSFAEPRYFTQMSSADYRGGEDPAMALVLDPTERRPLADLATEASRRGDMMTVGAIFDAWRQNPLNRYVDPVREVSAVGFALAAEAATAEAGYSLLRHAIRSFPQVASLWEALGETYERNGRRADALAAYQQALSLDPNSINARIAVRRLGGVR